MDKTMTLPAQPATGRAASGDVERWYFSAAMALLFVLAFIGFHRFYLHGRAFPDRELTPPIRGQVIAHGLIMSAWMVMTLVQPLLIARKNHRLHMKLGWLGVALAAAVTVAGVKLSIDSCAVMPPDMVIWAMSPPQFMAVPFWVSVVFGSCVAVAVWKRRRPAIHRAMLLMGTLVAMSAAISRIDTLNRTFVGTAMERLMGPFFTTAVVGALLVLAHGAITRRVDRWLWGSFAGTLVVFVLITQGARTELWQSAARGMMGMSS
jgi:hypothetical protein